MRVDGTMTTSEMVVRLREARDVFDAKAAEVPSGAFDLVPEGCAALSQGRRGACLGV